VFGHWVGNLGAYFPGVKGCGKKGNILLAYLSLVAYFDSVGVSHQ